MVSLSLSLSLFPFKYLCASQNFFSVCLQQDVFPGGYCIRNFPGPLRAQAMSLLSINCYCCLLLLASFHPYCAYFFLVSSDPTSFFFPTFKLLKLLHPYFGVKILFDVIINWENSEHDAMDEGSSLPTPSPLLSW
jgi:hypothetical protein